MLNAQKSKYNKTLRNFKAIIFLIMIVFHKIHKNEQIKVDVIAIIY